MKWGKVYAIMQDSAGVYWISTKGQGLIKAIETSQGNFKLQHFKHKADDPYSLSNDNIYFTFQDSRQRLWVATYGGGLNLIETMSDGTLRFINHRNLLKRYPISHFIKSDILLKIIKGVSGCLQQREFYNLRFLFIVLKK